MSKPSAHTPNDLKSCAVDTVTGVTMLHFNLGEGDSLLVVLDKATATKLKEKLNAEVKR